METKFADTNLAFITIDSGICNKCRWVKDDGETCKAYPDGIPEDILTGEVSHLKPQPNDRGIQFKARAGERDIKTFPEYNIEEGAEIDNLRG